jgi:hypothetical protein
VYTKIINHYLINKDFESALTIFQFIRNQKKSILTIHLYRTILLNIHKRMPIQYSNFWKINIISNLIFDLFNILKLKHTNILKNKYDKNSKIFEKNYKITIDDLNQIKFFRNLFRNFEKQVYPENTSNISEMINESIKLVENKIKEENSNPSSENNKLDLQIKMNNNLIKLFEFHKDLNDQKEDLTKFENKFDLNIERNKIEFSKIINLIFEIKFENYNLNPKKLFHIYLILNIYSCLLLNQFDLNFYNYSTLISGN